MICVERTFREAHCAEPPPARPNPSLQSWQEKPAQFLRNACEDVHGHPDVRLRYEILARASTPVLDRAPLSTPSLSLTIRDARSSPMTRDVRNLLLLAAIAGVAGSLLAPPRESCNPFTGVCPTNRPAELPASSPHSPLATHHPPLITLPPRLPPPHTHPQ